MFNNNSLLNTTLIRDVEPGSYWVYINHYEECKPEGKQPYILVEMTIDNLIVTDRWYASRIPYIMKCLRKQFRKDYMDCTLSQLLDLAHDNLITVQVSYDPRWGQQIDYNDET